MSEDGLQAIHDIQLGRVALNDGYTDDAKRLLEEAKRLLDRVQKSDRPLTVATEVKVGEKESRKEQKTVAPDLIPILSQLQIVEEYTEATPAKLDAVKKAREHIKKGERKEAIETLKLAQIGLASHDVSMPLAQTVAWLDEARRLIGAGKLYEANLELKKIDDGLVENTAVLSEPHVSADSAAK